MSKKLRKPERQLLVDIRSLIALSKQQLAVSVNATMSMLYWKIGNKIKQDILQNARAGYGEQMIPTLATQLTAEYGGSFSEKNLRRMIQFAETFPAETIVVSLIRQLSRTHILAVIPIEDPLKREFYIEMLNPNTDDHE